jgi:hypothetical protein
MRLQPATAEETCSAVVVDTSSWDLLLYVFFFAICAYNIFMDVIQYSSQNQTNNFITPCIRRFRIIHDSDKCTDNL